ncbi:MAG: hypothetical protein JO060_08895, partial [Candidatus Eremiobacteraeota bacterium]|nr:hypothetical protein [Candidatus Eremiobacteraeota bacterium]
MHRTARSVVFAAAIAGMVLVAASNAKGITRRPNLSESLGVALGVPLLTTFQKPALIAVDWSTSGLEYWPIKPGGGNNARKLSGPLGLGYASLVAHGNVVIAAKESPPEVLLYNVVTKQKRVLADPYGPPVDIAIGKDASLYVLDYVPGNNNVAWYPPGASKPKKLSCKGLGSGAIAVDSSGNVFVQ